MWKILNISFLHFFVSILPVLLILWSYAKLADQLSLQGSGATLPANLYQTTILTYLMASDDIPNTLKIEYNPTGSGRGKNEIKKGEYSNFDFVGTDSILKGYEYQENEDLQMYPTVAGAIVPIYNLPGLSSTDSITLTTSTLADIFRANITHWTDVRVIKENKEMEGILKNLSDPFIKLCVRKDKSGTTEIWTKALSTLDLQFNKSIGISSLPAWKSGAYYRTGGSGVAAFVSQTENSIGYLGLGDAELYELRTVSLIKGGKVIEADSSSLQHAVAEFGSSFGNNGDDPDHLTANIHCAKADLAWPIAGYTYIIINKDTLRSGATCQHRYEIVKFWSWFYSSKIAMEVCKSLGFAPLSQNPRDLVLQRLQSDIYCNDKVIYDQSSPTVIQFGLPDFMFDQFLHFTKYTYENLHEDVSFVFNISDSKNLRTALSSDGLDVAIVAHDSETLKMAESDSFFISPLVGIGFALIYNVQHDTKMDTLILDQEVMKDILSGTISHWNDPRIVLLNPEFKNINQSIFVIKNKNVAEYIGCPSLTGISFASQALTVETDREGLFAVKETQYSLALVHYSIHLISSNVSISRILRNDGTHVEPSVSTIAACAYDTYISETKTFDLSSSENSTCYPMSIAYYMFTKKYFSGVDCIDESSRGYLAAYFIQWLLQRGSIDQALETAKYVSLFSITNDVYMATKKEQLTILCDGRSILEIEANYNYISSWAFPLAWICSILVTLVGINLIVWISHNRKHPVVKGSQPQFLYLIIAGSIILTFTLIPLSHDDFGIEYVSAEGELNLNQHLPELNAACTSISWIYLTGYSLQFSALFVKVHRMKTLMAVSNAMKKIRVRFEDLIPMLSFSISMTWCFCVVQTVLAPLHWKREPLMFNTDGVMTQSYGHCHSEHFLPFFVVLVFCQVAGLGYGTYLSYETRNIEDHFVESKWITVVLLNMTSTTMFSTLLGIFMYTKPAALFIIAFINILMSGLCVVILMVVPKIWLVTKMNENTEILNYNSSAAMSQSPRLSLSIRDLNINSEDIHGSNAERSHHRRSSHQSRRVVVCERRAQTHHKKYVMQGECGSPVQDLLERKRDRASE